MEAEIQAFYALVQKALNDEPEDIVQVRHIFGFAAAALAHCSVDNWLASRTPYDSNNDCLDWGIAAEIAQEQLAEAGKTQSLAYATAAGLWMLFGSFSQHAEATTKRRYALAVESLIGILTGNPEGAFKERHRLTRQAGYDIQRLVYSLQLQTFYHPWYIQDQQTLHEFPISKEH
jgi:hypothetical protein